MSGFMAPTVSQFSSFGRTSTPTYGFAPSGFSSAGQFNAGGFGYNSASLSNAAGSAGAYAMPKSPRGTRATSQPRQAQSSPAYGARNATPTYASSPFRNASPAPFSGLRGASPIRGNFNGMAPASIAAATTGVALQPAGTPTAPISGSYGLVDTNAFSGTVMGGGAFQGTTSPITGLSPYSGQAPPQYLSTRLEQSPGTVASSASRSHPGTRSAPPATQPIGFGAAPPTYSVAF